MKVRGEMARPSEKGAAGDKIVCPPGLEDMADFLVLTELQFFVQMGLANDADQVLAGHGYGRAHHRALYFAARQPGIVSSDLASVLAISNQALAKVMKTLISDGLMEQMSDPKDRRLRRCYVTSTGLHLLRLVFETMFERVQRAIAAVSRGCVDGHIRLYRAMLTSDIAILGTEK